MVYKKRKKRGVSFRPNRNFIEGAVEDFLNQGGKITVLSVDTTEEKNTALTNDLDFSADQFLNDQ